MKLVFFFKIILSLLIVNFASSQDHQEEKFKEIALEEAGGPSASPGTFPNAIH